MAKSAHIRWTGIDEMARNLRVYRRNLLIKINLVAQYWQSVFVRYAMDNASWQDHTNNARQNLHAFVEQLANDTVVLYLSHGMYYGIYLETRYAERYAIIMPTIRRHLPAINRMLRGIFG